MRDVSGSRFMRMAGSDDFQNKLNRSSQPVGGDFTYESEGGTGNNGLVDQDMRINRAVDDGGWERQVGREKALPSQLGANGGYGPSSSSYQQSIESGQGSSSIPRPPSIPSYNSGSSSNDSFNSSSVVNKYIQNAARANPINVEALDKSIRSRPLYHEAKGKLEDLNTFGDMYRYGREESPKWNQPSPMEGVETPDFEGMYDRTKKDLDDYKV